MDSNFRYLNGFEICRAVIVQSFVFWDITPAYSTILGTWTVHSYEKPVNIYNNTSLHPGS
jgi:hypothetical protein